MQIKDFTTIQLAGMFDNTLLKPNASKEAFKKLCYESQKYGFKMVAVNSAVVGLCREYLGNSPVHVGAAVSFPFGQTPIETKVFEAEEDIRNGADEIDYVINLVELKDKNYNYVRREMSEIVKVCRANNVISKAIFENCYLTQEEKKALCKIALEVQPDFIKTSTGFGTGGATVEDVKFMKSIVKNKVKVKAAGGINNLNLLFALIDAGAERIGTSHAVQLIEDFKKQKAAG